MIDLDKLENPSKEYRGAPFWAWNSSLDKAGLEFQIKALKEMGFGGCHIHSRVGLEVPYLSDQFLDMMEFSIEKAKEEDMLICLYDEDRWPSGYGSGIVTKEKKFRAVHLLLTTVPYEESIVEEKIIYKANFAVGVRTNVGKLIAVYDVVLDSNGYLVEYNIIDATAKAKGTKWYAYIEENPPHTWYNGGAYVDVLNKDAIDSFIGTSYQKYKERFGKDFGKWIPSIFTDEPHMIFKTNLKTPFDKEDLFMPWTWNIQEKCIQKYHVNLIDNLPVLFWEMENNDRTIRYAFHKILADLFEESYSRNIGTWCEENNISFTGHYLYEETLFEQNRSDGDLMRMYRDMDLPGMDLLFDEVALTTAKQIQSIVHQYAKAGATSEEYGVTNWAFELRDYKFQSDWQAALGINKRVPHLSLMSLKGEAKRDFPASISYQAPWAKQMKVLEDHFARVNMLLEKGKPVVHVAVLHPIESYWLLFGPDKQTEERRKKLDQDFQNVTKWLLCNGIDFDYLDEELLQELYTDNDNTFGNMKYDVIILPAICGIRATSIEILKKFERNGGEVIIWGNKPQFVDGKKRESVLDGVGKVISYTKSALLESVEKYREVLYLNTDGSIDDAFIHQLKRCGKDQILFLASIEKPLDKDNPELKETTIRVKGNYHVAEYDTYQNKYVKTESCCQGDFTEVKCKIYEGNSLMLILTKDEEVQLLPGNVCNQSQKAAVPDKVRYSLEEYNVALLDQAEYSVDDETYMDKEEILKIDEKMRKKLGYRARSFNMAQPYSYINKDEEHQLNLRFSIESACNLENVYLALEEVENTSLFLNGQPVNKTVVGWYIDQEIYKIFLGKLHQGTNILEAKIKYRENTNLEAMYLLGDFSVHVKKDAFEIGEKKDLVSFENLVGQGFDFYGGNIRYIFDIDCPSGNLRIHIPKYRGSCVGIEIDGVKQSQCIIQAPFEFLFTNLTNGKHEIVLILYGNRFNTLSHLHDACKEDDCRSFPLLWRTEGENWTYEYQIRPMGIIEKPQIFV
ncbi:MAG TPA: hypothetical protein GXX75_11985 [Clostridiales bacterium]|nr:hypothetical protein [Clostridiales bacterium]